MAEISHRITAVAQQPPDVAPSREGNTNLTELQQDQPRSRVTAFKIPTWFVDGPVQYNQRFILALIPGIVLLGVVEGANLLAAVAVSVLAVFLVHHTVGSWNSVLGVIVAMLFLSVISLYSLAPLLWRSLLNYPLVLVAHFIILSSGGLWLLQKSAFRKYDPSLAIMLEKLLTGLFPLVLLLPTIWEHLMLFPVSYLSYTVLLTWFLGLSLFIVPLQSSFAKRSTPKYEGLILHRFVAHAYIGLFLLVPPAINWVLGRYQDITSRWLSNVLFMFLPMFLLTLLESQDIFYWIGVSKKLITYLRHLFGILVLLLSSMLLLINGEKGLLLFVLPLAFIQLFAIASFEQHELNVKSVGAIVGVCIVYILAYLRLPWYVVHYLDSVVPLPLHLLQVGLLLLSFVSVVLFVYWKKASHIVIWTGYTTVFVVFEHVLIREGAYPPALLLTTAALGAVVMQRLYTVRRISGNCAWVCVSIHLTKLTQLVLSANPNTLDVALAHLAVFLTSIAVLRICLYQTKKTLRPSLLILFTWALLFGLLLAVGPLLGPLWTAVTHTTIPNSLLIAFLLFLTSLYIMFGQQYLKKAPPPWLQKLPYGVMALALLLGVLQPECGKEIFEALVILVVHYFYSDKSAIFGVPTSAVLVVAWTTVLEWCVLISLVVFVITVLQKTFRWTSTLMGSFMGAFIGLLIATWLLHQPPTSPHSIEYAAVCSLASTMVARAATATKDGTYLDMILFAMQSVLFLTNFWTEIFTIDQIQVQEPDQPMLASFAPPTTRLHAGVFLVLAAAFRIKQHYLHAAEMSPSQTYMALCGNIACLIFYVLTILNPLHVQLVVSILVSSLVFLLIQQDELLLRISTSNFPLAPCALVAVVTLYIMDMSSLLSHITVVIGLSTFTAAVYFGELVCLLLSIPAHLLVIWYLWTGKGSVAHMSIYMMLALFVPSSLLAYLSTSPASITLAGIAITGLSLTAAQGQWNK